VFCVCVCVCVCVGWGVVLTVELKKLFESQQTL